MQVHKDLSWLTKVDLQLVSWVVYGHGAPIRQCNAHNLKDKCPQTFIANTFSGRIIQKLKYPTVSHIVVGKQFLHNNEVSPARNFLGYEYICSSFWKLIKENLTKTVGRPAGGALTHITFEVNIDPKRKRWTWHLWQEVTLCYYHHHEKERFSPCSATAQSTKDHHNSANEKPLYFKLPVSSNGPFVHNSLSQFPILLYKRVFSPLLYPYLHVIHHSHTSWIAILHCPQIHLFYW